MKRCWIWVVPDPNSFVSGGNRYNANIMTALQKRGEQVIRISPEESESQLNVGPDTMWIWDSMCLEYFDKMGHVLPGRSALLLHFLPSEKLVLFQKIFSKADLIILPGEGFRSLIASFGYEEEKTLLLIPGFEPVPVLIHKERLGPLKWMTIANLVPEKGLYEFLECNAWKVSPHLIPHLDIYGDDRLDPTYAKAISELVRKPTWGNKIQYKGRLQTSDLWFQMGNYDAFLTTSPLESYGMAVRESLQAGLPVFGLAGGHLPHLVDQSQKGLLFDQLQALCDFLANINEQDFRQQWPVPIAKKWRPEGPDWDQQASLLQAKVNLLAQKKKDRDKEA